MINAAKSIWKSKENRTTSKVQEQLQSEKRNGLGMSKYILYWPLAISCMLNRFYEDFILLYNQEQQADAWSLAISCILNRFYYVIKNNKQMS